MSEAIAAAPAGGGVGRRARRWGGLLTGRVVTIVAASLVIYLALAAAPGDPVELLLGPRATPTARAAVESELGLDKPVLTRYWDWLTGVVHGDFGQSLVHKTAVGPLLSARIGTTLILVGLAAIFLVAIGILLGIIGGAYPKAGPVVAAITGFLLGVPSFVAAVFFISFFAVGLGWFPVQGAGKGFLDQVYHLTLPALALALGFSAWVAQVSTASIREERSREHVETARGRGIAPARVFPRHVLRNAALPMVTVTGLAIAGLFAGAVVVEKAFNLAGLGTLLLEGVIGKDYNVVLAVSMILIAVFLVTTFVIDLLQDALDPRISRR